MNKMVVAVMLGWVIIAFMEAKTMGELRVEMETIRSTCK